LISFDEISHSEFSTRNENYGVLRDVGADLKCALITLRRSVIAGCSGDVAAPTSPTTGDSRAMLLAGDYALTISLDERCARAMMPTWSYRAHLTNEGGYGTVSVIGNGYEESTGVGQVYT